MKMFFLWACVILTMTISSISQVAINADNSAPDPSSGLDVKFTNKGFLPPRVTLQQMEQIVNPANGLMVFCTSDSKVYVFMTSLGQWKELPVGTGAVNPPFICGMNLTISHDTSGEVAPVNKTTTYGTVTGIPGEPTKCWITKNLGATQQATAVNDATEPSAGWYWQFNRKQGYQYITSRIPNTTWIFPINENSNWQTANDPCNLELGTGWRLPIYTEWYNVYDTGGWTNWNDPWGSALKLHTAGGLDYGNGALSHRGLIGHYRSSTQSSTAHGWLLYFDGGSSGVGSSSKAFGFSVRCISD